MTRQEFETIISEVEAITGRKLSQEWRDSRFQIVKKADAESFRQSAIENLKTGDPVFEITKDSSPKKT